MLQTCKTFFRNIFVLQNSSYHIMNKDPAVLFEVTMVALSEWFTMSFEHICGYSTGSSLKSRLRESIRRKRRGTGDEEDEYSQDDIKKKFQRMPKLTQEEVKIIRSSWKLMQKRIDQVRTFWENFWANLNLKGLSMDVEIFHILLVIHPCVGNVSP